MKYEEAPDLRERMIDFVNTLEMEHIDLARIECLRSFGSSTKRTIARCHALGKVMQKAMKTKAFYTIEFLEKFDKMSKSDQDKVIIHELLHVPKTFGGGFRQHDFVCEENIEKLYGQFLRSKGLDDGRLKVGFGNKKFNVEVKRLSLFGYGLGLTFKTRNTPNLLFDLSTNFLPKRWAITSYLVFFPFLALWLDKKNKVIEWKIVKPFTFSVKPKKNFAKLVEIPLNEKNKKIISIFRR